MPCYVEQVEGVSNITPWGLHTRVNVRFQESDPAHIKYFQTNSRYRVSDIDVEQRRSQERSRLRNRSQVRQGRSGPVKGGVALTEARIVALAKQAIKQTDSKVKLLALASDLGVEEMVDKDTRNSDLVKIIKAKQAAILAAAEPESAEPEGDEDEDDDEGGEPGDDGDGDDED